MPVSFGSNFGTRRLRYTATRSTACRSIPKPVVGSSGPSGLDGCYPRAPAAPRPVGRDPERPGTSGGRGREVVVRDERGRRAVCQHSGDAPSWPTNPSWRTSRTCSRRVATGHRRDRTARPPPLAGSGEPPPELIERRFEGVLAEGVITTDDLVGELRGTRRHRCRDPGRQHSHVNVSRKHIPPARSAVCFTEPATERR